MSKGNDFGSGKFRKPNPSTSSEIELPAENVMEQESAVSSSSRDGDFVLSEEVHKLCEKVQDHDSDGAKV